MEMSAFLFHLLVLLLKEIDDYYFFNSYILLKAALYLYFAIL